ncbi:hypothetical protein, partial [Staphylococcus chromogenes]|uniref:hypothetical protein n=1 Tax=Staphylococcus chromogenes TaxID=46126 RepID=UPI001A7E05D6
INILPYYNEIVGESPTEHIKRVDIKKKGFYRHGKFNNNGEKYGTIKNFKNFSQWRSLKARKAKVKGVSYKNERNKGSSVHTWA